MYWEAALPIILAVGGWWSIGRAQRRWLSRSVAVAAGFIVIEAIILSASRAALVSAAVALGILMIADRISSVRSGVGRTAGISLIALGVFIGIQVIMNPLFTARLRSESDDSWFRAAIQPAQAALIAPAGDIFTTTVTVTNTSVQTWSASGLRPVNVSYHWIQPGSQRVLILDGERTPLPHDLAPGESAAVSAVVIVPPITGTLLLQWDLVQEDVTWFSERGSAMANVKVQVTAAQQQTIALALVHGQLSDTSSPPRAELWRAGVQMWLSHPLLGIGPDNFRHIYGQYLGQAAFDDRITANSWYVELLATTGVIGLLSWALIPGALIMIVRRQWRTVQPAERILAIGLGVALSAFFLHGTVDYFMEFTPTYGLFWLIAGLLVGLLTGTHDVEFAGTADRI
jgi:O-antigen ligase